MNRTPGRKTGQIIASSFFETSEIQSIKRPPRCATRSAEVALTQHPRFPWPTSKPSKLHRRRPRESRRPPFCQACEHESGVVKFCPFKPVAQPWQRYNLLVRSEAIPDTAPSVPASKFPDTAARSTARPDVGGVGTRLTTSILPYLSKYLEQDTPKLADCRPPSASCARNLPVPHWQLEAESSHTPQPNPNRRDEPSRGNTTNPAFPSACRYHDPFFRWLKRCAKVEHVIGFTSCLPYALLDIASPFLNSITPRWTAEVCTLTFSSVQVVVETQKSGLVMCRLAHYPTYFMITPGAGVNFNFTFPGSRE